MFKKFLVPSSDLHFSYSSFLLSLQKVVVFYFLLPLLIISCITKSHIESISFEDIKDIKLEDAKNGEKIIYANIVLKNKEKVKFTLKELNLHFFWKSKTFEVRLNDAIENIHFGGEKEIIPVQAYIPANLFETNLLSLAFETLTGEKQKIRAKGSVSLKKFFLKKTIEIDETISFGL